MAGPSKCPKGMGFIPEGPFKKDMGYKMEAGGKRKYYYKDVDVPGLCMDRHEVTDDKYESYQVKSGKERFEISTKSCRTGTLSLVARVKDTKALVKEIKERARSLKHGKDNCVLEIRETVTYRRSVEKPDFKGQGKPVTEVNWHEANAYCKAQGKRLPTGDEWEKAASGTYGTYSGPDKLNKKNARYDASEPAEVCSYEASKHDLCDMVGNVREWVSDLYQDEGENKRIARGGDWNEKNPEFLRASFQTTALPTFSDLSTGFRCAATPLSEVDPPPPSSSMTFECEEGAPWKTLTVRCERGVTNSATKSSTGIRIKQCNPAHWSSYTSWKRNTCNPIVPPPPDKRKRCSAANYKCSEYDAGAKAFKKNLKKECKNHRSVYKAVKKRCDPPPSGCPITISCKRARVDGNYPIKVLPGVRSKYGDDAAEKCAKKINDCLK